MVPGFSHGPTGDIRAPQDTGRMPVLRDAATSARERDQPPPHGCVIHAGGATGGEKVTRS